MVLARLVEQGVDPGEVEPALLRLDLLPGDRHFQRIGVQLVDRRPDHRQLCRRIAGIVGLRPQHQEGRAVDHQRIAAVMTDKMWQVGRRLRMCARGHKHGGGEEARINCADHEGRFLERFLEGVLRGWA